jgi:hypothetical protein
MEVEACEATSTHLIAGQPVSGPSDNQQQQDEPDQRRGLDRHRKIRNALRRRFLSAGSSDHSGMAFIFQGTEPREVAVISRCWTRLPAPTNSTINEATISSTPDSMKVSR